jgi:putative transposase
VTQRGNGRRAVFYSDEDRKVYLQLLWEYGECYGVRWWGYCLMSNHVHLVAVPRKENALANRLRRAHSDYARYANVKLRAGIVSEAGDYAWSSAPTRLSDSDGSEFLDLAPWRRSYSPEQWRDVLERGMSEEAQLERIREATRTGRRSVLRTSFKA